MQAILVIHDVRSAQNVGALFRTADSVGIQKIYLSAITPSPIDRFGRPRNDVAKTALGSEKNLPWEQYSSIEQLIQSYKTKGYSIVAIEQDSNSKDYKSIQHEGKMVFVVGNEVTGLSQDILSLVDVVAEIPMKGEKESLNVAIAAGIALFRILDN